MTITEKTTLDEILTIVKNSKVEQKQTTKDGRVNSAILESCFLDEIYKSLKDNKYFIENNLEIIIPEARCWYDLLVKDETNNIYLPINLKITDLDSNQNDNLNCKLGIYYAFTGKIPNFNNEIGWDKFYEELEKGLEDKKTIKKDKDYYFLVIDKKDYKNSFYNSLKKLEKLVPNGSNPPFQCRWNINKVPYERTYEESIKYIEDIIEETENKKCKSIKAFEKYKNRNKKTNNKKTNNKKTNNKKTNKKTI